MTYKIAGLGKEIKNVKKGDVLIVNDKPIEVMRLSKKIGNDKEGYFYIVFFVDGQWMPVGDGDWVTLHKLPNA